jgi:hypothetical protein
VQTGQNQRTLKANDCFLFQVTSEHDLSYYRKVYVYRHVYSHHRCWHHGYWYAGDWPPGLLVLTAVRLRRHPHWTFRSIAMGRKCSKDTAMQPKSNARHTYAIFNQDTISSSARGETSATFLRRCKCLFMQSRFSLNAFKVAKILLWCYLTWPESRISSTNGRGLRLGRA